MELEKVIPQINLKNNGLLMLCQNEQKLIEEYALADKALSMGLNIEKLDRDDFNKFQLGTTVDAAGGVYYKTDAHLSPVNLTNGLIKLLKDKKVKMYENCELLDFVSKNGVLSGVATNKEVFEFDELVLATGYLSQKLFNKLQIKAKVQPGKGYSFDYQPQSKLNLPAILVDARVAVTPYQNYIRFAGAMEIGGNQDSVKTKKIIGMVKAINSFFPDFSVKMPEENNTWIGLRPCSHDGLPYIGRITKFKNVVVATGHSMMGVSLAPATAKITEELISGKKLSFNIEPFNPDR